ncbi:ROK family transcriptional regulator [Streptomyces sp. NPDC094032]|uniref:ROK family transcriptional regulator n=1 Tax=Streptomyces sp. NPDC094032 TaxID=3155308 RepID=UPI003320D88B
MRKSVATPSVRVPSRPPRVLDALPAVRQKPSERVKAQDGRAHNRSLVLATLYHRGAMSRADLTRVCGLTAPTISALVADLEAEGLVADSGPLVGAGLRRGKPSSLVEIRDDAAVLVALDLSPSDCFRGAVTDLRGRVLARAETPLGKASGAAAAALVEELVAELLARAPRRVLGVGIASPGIVDDRGTVRQAGHLGWTELPLTERLGARFGVPVHVGNDVNAAALAAWHFHDVRAQNLMVITTEHGVGAGLIIGGELVEGEQFAAGEIGHITVAEDGEPCVCGRSGCLDPLIDSGHLRRRLAAAPAAGRPAVLAEAGRALGIVLAPIASVLNLNEVVVAGPADLLEGPFVEAAHAAVQARTLHPISASVHIRVLSAYAELTLLGGVCLVLAAELGVL